MFNKHTVAAALVAGAVASAPAQAAVLTYEFLGGSDNQSSHSVVDTSNTLSVLVSGFDETGAVANINRHNNGWGVNGDPANNRIGLDEVLQFDWSPSAVSLLSGVIFERGSAPQELFDLVIDGVTVLDDFAVPEANGSNRVAVTFNQPLFGSVFRFVGQTPIQNGDNQQGLRIRGLTVQVPEPAGWALALVGLGLLGFRRAR